MARRAKADIESEWYDVFATWTKEDRAAAIRVLQTLHPRLPDNPKAKAEPEQAALPGVKA